MAQQRLAKLGYTFNGDELDSATAQAMLLIDAQVNERMQKEAEKASKRRR